MFGIGFFELCIIAVVALIFVGPQRLPELMQQFGKFFVQIRRMSNEVKHSVDEVIAEAEDELRQKESPYQRPIAAMPEQSSTPRLEKPGEIKPVSVNFTDIGLAKEEDSQRPS